MSNGFLAALVFACLYLGVGLLEHPEKEEAERLVECYSDLLGIEPPRLRLIHSFSSDHVEGVSPNAREILVSYSGLSKNTLAHEVAHTWQWVAGFPFDYSKPYSQRPHEIHAFNWAEKNSHRC